MKFWNNVMNGLRARKGEFTGTSGNEANISKRIDSNQTVNISSPTSYRTYQNVGKGTLDENDIDVGLTSGKGAEIASTAIKNARYDPTDNSLNITYQGGDKEYKFAATPEDVKKWMNSPSKGKITQSWTKNGSDPHTYPGY